MIPKILGESACVLGADCVAIAKDLAVADADRARQGAAKFDG